MPEVAPKPRLTLGLKRPPLALEAFKAKIGLKTAPAAALGPTMCEPVTIIETCVMDAADAGSMLASHMVHETKPASAAPASLEVRPVSTLKKPSPVSGIPSAPSGGMPSSKGLARRRRPASILAIAAADLFPAISIAGEPVPVEATKSYPDAKAAERAARHWCRRIALEVAALAPEPQSQDAELFTMRYRLSITNAFHRRLRRADVISSILGLFLSQGRVPATCPPVPE
jgi:hypothetical protein